MLLLTTVLFWLAGTCDSVQRLTCPYDLKDEGLPRVWCNQISTQCCTGFSFSRQRQSLDAGRLEVTQGADTFTVDSLGLAQGEGMYWCGLLGRNETIIKLAEEYFYSTSSSYVWNILRWILILLLPVAIIFSYCYLYRKHQHKEDLYMNIALTSYLAQNDPQNEDSAEQTTEL